MNYKVIIMYDKEFEGYVVDVPALTGCMSQGKTIDEALENIKDAIRGWLYVEKKHNRSQENQISELLIGEVTI
jgi:predicted RNase H-like HicB family nuclease